MPLSCDCSKCRLMTNAEKLQPGRCWAKLRSGELSMDDLLMSRATPKLIPGQPWPPIER